jgi:hypothetical protein
MGYKLSTFTFSASYTTGGEAWDPKGLADHPTPAVLPFPKSGYVFENDPVNKKIKAFYGDNNNAADGPLIEVAAGVNVGAIGPVTLLLLPQS